VAPVRVVGFAQLLLLLLLQQPVLLQLDLQGLDLPRPVLQLPVRRQPVHQLLVLQQLVLVEGEGVGVVDGSVGVAVATAETVVAAVE